MILALAVAAAAITSAGVFLVLARDLLRIVVGVSLLGYAANLVIFVSGRPAPGRIPPILDPSESALPVLSADPVTQALILTAIVISFALTCYSLLLALAIGQRMGHIEGDALREVEPPPAADGSPEVDR